MNCSSTCRTKDHATFGECIRAKGVQFDEFSLTQNGQPLEKRKNHTLDRFAKCCAAGVTPEAPTKTEVAKAEAKLNGV